MSHAQRTQDPSVNSLSVNHRGNYLAPVLQLTSEQVVNDDRVVKQSYYKAVDPRENFSGVKVEDFYIENLVAIGAFENLKQCQISPDVMSVSDSINSAMDVIGNSPVVNVVESSKSE